MDDEYWIMEIRRSLPFDSPLFCCSSLRVCRMIIERWNYTSHMSCLNCKWIWLVVHMPRSFVRLNSVVQIWYAYAHRHGCKNYCLSSSPRLYKIICIYVKIVPHSRTIITTETDKVDKLMHGKQLNQKEKETLRSKPFEHKKKYPKW